MKKKLFTWMSAGILTTLLSVTLTQAQNRVAVLEDFRGHKCGLCPAGDVIANSLDSQYGDSLIVVAVHAGFLSTPNGSGTHTTDFRTTAGNAYNTLFGITGNPTGVVNRTMHSGNTKLSQTQWDDAVQNIIYDVPAVNFTIENGYDSTSRQVSLRVKGDYKAALTGAHSLIVYVLEDSIVDNQTDYGSTPNLVTNYLHRHVLRDNVNGTWGTSLFTSSISIGDSTLNEFSYELDASWKEKDISFVAYVYDESNNEIINAAEYHIDLMSAPLFAPDTMADTTGTDSTTGILNNNLNIEFQLYPNPADEYVVIQMTNGHSGQVVIRDLQGRLVEQIDLNKPEKRISIEGWERGIYLVEMHSKGNGSEVVEYRKLIVN